MRSVHAAAPGGSEKVIRSAFYKNFSNLGVADNIILVVLDLNLIIAVVTRIFDAKQMADIRSLNEKLSVEVYLVIAIKVIRSFNPNRSPCEAAERICQQIPFIQKGIGFSSGKADFLNGPVQHPDLVDQSIGLLNLHLDIFIEVVPVAVKSAFQLRHKSGDGIRILNLYGTHRGIQLRTNVNLLHGCPKSIQAIV